ncbi:hypothetical protein Vafri_9614 [Volvox africanus]|uniref:Uncharacterized protein n=1 Tax=Volvox africanus TaxID=51714 RepID=A0A8J4F1P0_9CHLO|nr:hypothetical protein Vafri_9614 [Volvox africanus]
MADTRQLALAASIGQLCQAHQAAAQATQAVQQAVAGLQPPDGAFQHQINSTMQQHQQQMQKSHQDLQQQMQKFFQDIQQQMQRDMQQMQQDQRQHQQQMQRDMQQMCQEQQQMQRNVQQIQVDIVELKADFRAVWNLTARVHNKRAARNELFHWLFNDQGLQPSHAAISRKSLNQVVVSEVNSLLDHYGLHQRAVDMNAMDRRYLLLEHLGAERPEA